MRGIDIVLYERTKIGFDPFGSPVYVENPVTVSNVLVGLPTANEQVDATDLYGKKAVYTLGLPKGDAHNWEAGTHVEFFGQRYETFGDVIQGIEALVPTAWHKKVMVSNVGLTQS